MVAKTADGKTIEAPPPADEEDEKAAEVLFDKSQTLESEGKSTEAQGQRDEIVKAYPGTRFGAQLLEKLARDAESRGDIATALSTWEKLLLHRPGYENMESAHENYARLLIEVGRYKDASLILKPLFENAESDGQKAARGRLLARALTKLGSGRDAVQILVAIRALPGIPNDSKLRLSTQIMSTLSTGLSFADATQLWDNVRNDSQWAFAHPLLAYKIAKISYHVRDYETADEMLQLVIKNYGSSSYGAGARKLKKRLDARFTVAPDKVGVLLPLTGRFQQYGKRALEAVKLALGTNSKIQLVVKDTAGDGPTATKAVEDLVLEDHV
ncbi:hypothetical protein KAI87_15445, partial [Myxococcota bacterium]|nr:hypothetical protein [Myxococcota bacterium]